ncbi:ABC transporter permease [Borrelia parkeri]|uniref:Oligopeptide transport system permease protein oppC n=1 Tax=Borrelia parkeri SLO TaxID=1313294 RepID=A0ABM5PKG1_BORPR|nr:ABC transporter permease [Borrelia parkeri]AHE62663.1 peptide ABC transporter permease [Borrelia parkeri HR1]AHH09600.1 Oligopeptide transport system permease protein oppC [Borrelia parkeri SLO]UPA10504.1 ABC transporter permease [Borrelia parkeri]
MNEQEKQDTYVEIHTANKRAWLRFKENKLAFISIFIIGFYILIAILRPILPIYKYHTQVVEHADLPPSLKYAGELWYEKELHFIKRLSAKEKREINKEEKAKLEEIKRKIETEVQTIDGKEIKIHKRIYLLGTDNLGRDLLARIIQGSQISISVGFIGALISMIIGTIIGAIAGFFDGIIDRIITKIIEIFYVLPTLLVIIILMTVMERNIIGVFIAISIISWLTIARIVRGQVKSLARSEFIQAARTLGATNKRMIFKHLIPNSFGMIVIITTMNVPSFIMLESFLSFLGLGISAPMTSWGELIKNGIPTFIEYPWKIFIPATVMTIFLLFMNFLGDGLRDAFDPKDNL